MTPAISIVTCAYNRPTMLKEAIVSIQAQTRADWEHLIVDAGSEDPDVWRVIASASAEDRRIRGYRSPPPNGDRPAVHWNAMIDRIRGKYVCFLDDDNTKMPKFIEAMAGILDAESEFDVVTCGFLAVFENGSKEENHLNASGRDVLETNTVDTGCFLIRREALERIGYFPENVRTNEDWAMVKRMFTVLRIRHLSDCLATWREHGGQRMKRCTSLGNDQDKSKIRGSDWPAFLGVRVVLPEIDIGDVAAGVVGAISEIPWVDPKRSDVALIPVPSRVRDHVSSKVAVCVIADGETSDDVSMAVRALRTSCAFVWAAGSDPVVLSAANASGALTITCPVGLEGLVGIPDPDYDPWTRTWRTRVVRILNAARSPRFSARIP